MLYQKVNNSIYEILEVHNTSRDLYCLVLITTQDTTVYTKVSGVSHHLHKPKGSMVAIVSDTTDKPEFANFIESTTSISKIHKKVDFIRESLANENLKVTIKGKEYKVISGKYVNLQKPLKV